MRTLLRIVKPACALFTLLLASCAILSMGDMSNLEIRVMLSGANEVPPVDTSASGAGTIFVAADKTINGAITTTDIVGIAAHIHIGAAGTNGPVIFPLARDGANTWLVPTGTKISDAQFENLKKGELYINVHSAAHKGGEIRGQLTP